jgi:putative tributyrin esterase
MTPSPVRLLAATLALAAAAPLAAQQRHGQVRIESFFSAALGVGKHYVVYLPPSYAHRPHRRFPVAYYLHGLTGNEGDWVTLGGIDRVADSLVGAGMPEMILVLPDGDDGWYANWATPRGFAACMTDTLVSRAAAAYCVEHERYDDYVALDLIGHVDSVYRTLATRAHRGIAGLSMGGYGAIALALRHPDRFAAAASHSGVLSPLYSGPHPFAPPAKYLTDADSIHARWRGLWPDVSRAFGTDASGWYARDPARLARKLQAAGEPMPAILIDVGTEDGLPDQNRAFHWELEQMGVAHAYAEWPGKHDWKYWPAHVGESLRFLAEHIAH